MKTITVTEAGLKLHRLLGDVAESREAILITGKRTNAVLISEANWRAIEETMYLLSSTGMRESIIEGLNTPVEGLPDDTPW